MYIENQKSSFSKKAQIFWFVDVFNEMELWALAAVVALVEQRRMGKDLINFTTAVALGAGVWGRSGSVSNRACLCCDKIQRGRPLYAHLLGREGVVC